MFDPFISSENLIIRYQCYPLANGQTRVKFDIQISKFSNYLTMKLLCCRVYMYLPYHCINIMRNYRIKYITVLNISNICMQSQCSIPDTVTNSEKLFPFSLFIICNTFTRAINLLHRAWIAIIHSISTIQPTNNNLSTPIAKINKFVL